jgi:hypothetical protein
LLLWEQEQQGSVAEPESWALVEQSKLKLGWMAA